MFSKVIIATGLAVFIFVLVYVFSDAPLRVHLANALGLLLAFWVPALLLRGWNDLKERAFFFAALVVAGTLVWDVVSASVIVKRDFLMGAAVVYPAALVACFALFALQVGLHKFINQESI